DRSQQAENCIHDFECQGVSRNTKRNWELRWLHLAVRRRKAENQPLEIIAAVACANARVRCDEQGFEETRLPLRRLHDLLCLHASHRHGQRSLRRLHPPRRGVAIAATPISGTNSTALSASC